MYGKTRIGCCTANRFREICRAINEEESMATLLHAELTGTIIKAYYQVYNSLSQTFPEFIYERAIMRALEKQGISCVKQDEYQIFYKDRLVGLQRKESAS